jgi:hypothetical protein
MPIGGGQFVMQLPQSEPPVIGIEQVVEDELVEVETDWVVLVVVLVVVEDVVLTVPLPATKPSKAQTADSPSHALVLVRHHPPVCPEATTEGKETNAIALVPHEVTQLEVIRVETPTELGIMV